MSNVSKNKIFFDEYFPVTEQLPREFTVTFKDVEKNKIRGAQVYLNSDVQIGDIIDDNSHIEDYYRYHDVFHYTFATLLGWSPCSRVLMKRKRKSNSQIDRVEDGARATITEEAISLIIFNEAKRKNFFSEELTISKKLLKIIKEMTEPYEVRVRTTKEWKNAIEVSYNIFRNLILHNGGKVYFNANKRIVLYSN